MSVRLVHFARNPVTTVLPAVQQPGMKPQGLWVSDEADFGWSTWCRAENFRMEDLAVEHRVELHPDAGVLRIDTPEAIDAFNARFGQEGWSVDWGAVAREHPGILISPYQWCRRLRHLGWYYTWDCASGCIWDPAAIASIEVVPTQTEAAAA